MQFKKFHEYVNSRGKIEKPKVDVSGDQVDPKTPPNKPPKSEKPYIAKGEKNSNKPFGDQGDKSLIFNYDTKGKGKAPAKIPTVESVHYELAPLVREAVEHNPLVVEAVVRELKRHQLLAPLVAELLEHKETFKHIAEVMAHEEYGVPVCRKLVRAMREEVAPPLHASLSGKEMEEEPDYENGDPNDGEGEDPDEEDFDDLEDEEDFEDEDDLGGEEPDLDAPPMEPGMGMDQMGPMGPAMGPMPPKQMGPPAMANFQRAMMGRW